MQLRRDKDFSLSDVTLMTGLEEDPEFSRPTLPLTPTLG